MVLNTKRVILKGQPCRTPLSILILFVGCPFTMTWLVMSLYNIFVSSRKSPLNPQSLHRHEQVFMIDTIEGLGLVDQNKEPIH